MGGRLSHQRSTRPLVPANFLDRNAPFPPAFLAGARNTGPLRQGSAASQAAGNLFSPKALAPTGGSREILRKSARRE